jgi:hypothetical protein
MVAPIRNGSHELNASSPERSRGDRAVLAFATVTSRRPTLKEQTGRRRVRDGCRGRPVLREDTSQGANDGLAAYLLCPISLRERAGVRARLGEGEHVRQSLPYTDLKSVIGVSSGVGDPSGWASNRPEIGQAQCPLR